MLVVAQAAQNVSMQPYAINVIKDIFSSITPTALPALPVVPRAQSAARLECLYAQLARLLLNYLQHMVSAFIVTLHARHVLQITRRTAYLVFSQKLYQMVLALPTLLAPLKTVLAVLLELFYVLVVCLVSSYI